MSWRRSAEATRVPFSLPGKGLDSHRALQIGLAHKVVSTEQLDTEIEKLMSEVLSSGPLGIERAKQLIESVPDLQSDEAMQLTAETIAALRVSTEGQEGLQAFLEKRKPGWAG